MPKLLSDLLARFFTREPGRIDWHRTGLLVLAIVAVIVAVWLWFHPRTLTTMGPPRLMPGETVTVVAPPKVLRQVKTVTVPGPERLVTIPGPEVVKYIEVPQYIQADANELPIALAESDIKTPEGDDAGTAKTAVFLNRSTGQATVVQQQTPAGFFALENRGELGLWYGYNQHAKEVLQGDLSWYFLRLGPAHIGIRAEGDNAPTLKALGGLKLGW